jgi:hypothetical protein
MILTADNIWRLNNLLDPWLHPALSLLKQRVKSALHQGGLRRRSMRDMGVTFHSPRFIDKALARANLTKVRSATLGFGPFTLLRRVVVPEPLGTALHHRLQRLADRNVPGLRSAGAHYIVLARKSMSQSKGGVGARS